MELIETTKDKESEREAKNNEAEEASKQKVYIVYIINQSIKVFEERHSLAVSS